MKMVLESPVGWKGKMYEVRGGVLSVELPSDVQNVFYTQAKKLGAMLITMRKKTPVPLNKEGRVRVEVDLPVRRIGSLDTKGLPSGWALTEEDEQ